MANRVQVTDPLQSTPGLNPTIVPRDNFVVPTPPQDPRETLLGQLATGLGVAAKMGQEYKPIYDEQEQARARKEFIEAGYPPLKEAVDKGLIKPGQSPAFRREWEHQYLRIKAHEFDKAMRQAYASDGEVTNSDDPAVLEGFMLDFTKQWMDDNGLAGYHDTDLADAFFPLVDQSASVLRQRHVETRVAQIENDVEVRSQVEANQLIQGALAQGGELDVQALAFELSVLNERTIAGGRDKVKANASTIDAVVTAAIESGEADVLDVLDYIPAGPGSALGGTTKARDAVARARYTIQQREQAEARHTVWMQDQEREALTRRAMGAVFVALENDPTVDISKYLQELAKVDPKASIELERWRRSTLDETVKVRELPGVVADLYNGLRNGSMGARDILGHAYRGLIDPATAKDAFRFMERNERFKPLFETRDWTKWERRIEEAITAAQRDEWGYASPGAVVNYTNAVNDFRDAAMDWIEENGGLQNYSRTGLRDFLRKEFDTMMRDPQYGIDPRYHEEMPPARYEETKVWPVPPKAAIELAKQDPEGKLQFEEVFGPGSWDKYVK